MKSKKDGFTLVELVIVIAIIAILAAILVPTFSSVIASAHKSADIQQMKHVNLMLLSGDIDKTHLYEYALQTDGWELAYSEDRNNVVIVGEDDIIVEAESKNLVGKNAGDNDYIRVSLLDFGDKSESKDPNKQDPDDPNKGDNEQHEHKMTKIEGQAPTCTEAGNKEYYKCKECGNFYSDEAGENKVSETDMVLSAAGHKMTKIEGKAPTCTEAGNKEYYKCSKCGNFYSDKVGENKVSETDMVLSAAGHKMTKIERQAPTCTEAGNKEYYKCTECGNFYSDEAGENKVSETDMVLSAAGHKMTKIERQAPTCTEAGNKEYYKCTECGNFYSDEAGENKVSETDMVLSAAGHKMTKIERQAPTCTEAGNKEYYKCTECGKIFKDIGGATEFSEADVTINATGHSYDSWQYDESSHLRECACGDVESGLHIFDKDNKCTTCDYKKKDEQKEWDFVIVDNDDLKSKADEIKGKDQNFTVYLEDNVTAIKGFFNGNKRLTRIRIGAGITQIPAQAFMDCSSLTEVLLGGEVIKIGSNAFNGCSALTEVVWGDKLAEIDSYAFCDCIALKTLALPHSVKRIQENSFNGCTFDEFSLSCVTIETNDGSLGHVDLKVRNLTITGGAMENETGTTSNVFTSWLGEILNDSQDILESLSIYNTDLSDTNVGKTNPFIKYTPAGTTIIIDQASFATITKNSELYRFFEKYVQEDNTPSTRE